ncbi:MAG: fused MFS/spermidine synthase [Pirellulaceae bacterium]|nr:fused MFS/spermidine synthase [Pirellulaceae bacterium]
MNRNRTLSLAFAATIFLSAFLLFLVQPLISKIILPWFGGSTGVWATCLVFFQSMLCLGYAYAHFLQRLPIRTQRWCHWIVLVLGLVCLPVMPGEAWKPVEGNDPAYKIFIILLLKTGPPYLALSATGPLLQAWFARIYPEARTYRLYALSNIASLSSLLLFPLWFERVMPSSGLSNVWSGLFVAFVGLCGYVAYRVSVSEAAPLNVQAILMETDSGQVNSQAHQSAPLPRHYLLWLFLPAFASFLLLAGTNHLCQDIASTPFLWILPLCLYLLSFILCFDAPRWYVRRFYVVMGLAGLYGVIAMRELDDAELLSQGWLANAVVPLISPILRALEWYSPNSVATTTWVSWLESQVVRSTFNIGLIGQIFFHCIALFAVFMVCHGELAKRKPPARYLTAFYLMISIGGAIGSAFVSLIAPQIFPGIWEWHFGLALSVAIFCGLLFHWTIHEEGSVSYRFRYVLFVLPCFIVCGLVIWQSSHLPLQLAAMVKSKFASPMQVVKRAELPDLHFGEDISDTFDNVTVTPPHLLESWVAITGGVFFIVLLGLGAFELRKREPGLHILRWAVTNAAATIAVSIFLYDILHFLPKELFEGHEPPNAFSVTENNVWRERNFYGALTIEQTDNPNLPDESYRSLQHGRIVHGTQFTSGYGMSTPTTYYAKSSGVGIALEYLQEQPKIKIGAIGLGTGTLAAYAMEDRSLSSISAKAADSDRECEMTIYEINPLVVGLSQGDKPWFTYLEDAKKRGAMIEIVLGDARLMMEREESRGFDVLAVDAFSGDSIPIHLLTDEAMKIYIRHLSPEGILAIHISNRYLDLEPICKALANAYGFEARVVESDDRSEDGAYTSTWVLLSKDVSLMNMLDDSVLDARTLSVKQGILWTDAYSSLYEVLLNSDVDDAVSSIVETHWYRKASTTRATLELKHQSKWWRDGWVYFQTWPLSDDLDNNRELRIKGGRLEIRPLAGRNQPWQSAE